MAQDSFDPNSCEIFYKLSANNTKIVKWNSSNTSAYLKKVVNTGMHKWRFKMGKTSTNNYTTVIGVWKAKYTKKTSQTLWEYYYKGRFYGWNLTHNNITSGDGDETKWYGDRVCKEGDIIQMMLDLDKLTLTYHLNGKSQGIAFQNIEKCEYNAESAERCHLLHFSVLSERFFIGDWLRITVEMLW